MPPRGRTKHWGPLPGGGSGTPALVAVINRKKDFQILKEQRWYRIPVSHAPDGLERVKFIAFYQTKAFGDEGWAVNYYAAVERIRRARRIELLPDEPGHPRAGEFYYRVAIGELARLPRPIPSQRWRRIVFIPTTLERLFHAREINDLYWTSPLEEKLYRALRRAGLTPERQFYVGSGAGGYFLDLAIFCREGVVDVECDGASYHTGLKKAEQDRQRDNCLTLRGWRILRFSGREIRQNLRGCVEMVKRMVKNLGGGQEG